MGTNTKIRISSGKFGGINAVADETGIIAAAAMDQRGSLKKAIAKARGSDATSKDLSDFKIQVTNEYKPNLAILEEICNGHG